MKRMFIVVRADLDPGLQLAQSNHAAFQMAIENPEDVWDWHKSSNNLIVKHVPDEAALKALVEHPRVTGGRVYVQAFHEPDLGGAMTAAAFYGSGANAFLRELPLAFESLPAGGKVAGQEAA